MPVWTVWVVAWHGCSCQPDLPSNSSSDSSSTATTAATGDTAPEARCAAPEAEPNGSTAEATGLPLERWACGGLEELADADWWSFAHDEDGWLKLEVDAANGSVANLTLLVTPQFASWSAKRNDDPESEDVTLLFPAPAGDYWLSVQDQLGNGGERFGYDLLVSEAKPPVEWTAIEAEPNDGLVDALPLASGDVAFGVLSSESPLPDFDYYVVLVPAGPHVVRVDMDAFERGSSALADVVVRDQAGVERKTIPHNGNVEATVRDAAGTYLSDGSEVLYLQVVNGDDFLSESPAHWYAMTVTLEAP